MLAFENGGMLVQRASELPVLRGSGCRDLFLDFETTGMDGESDGLRPYHGSKICGVCVTWDENPNAWYVPVRHNPGAVNREYPNLPEATVRRWLYDAFREIRNTGGRWINHNVKFDAHFAAEEGIDLSQTKMVCTVMGARMVDTDRGFGTPGYGLDELSVDWLGEDMSEGYQSVKRYLEGIKLPHRKKCQDYGRVPVDIMAFYGTNDVLKNRPLHRYIEERIHDEAREAWRTEQALTPVLFDVEREGMRVDVGLLEREEYRVRMSLLRIEEAINKDVGFPVRPHTNEDCFDLLCNYHGLPVLGWTTDARTGQQTTNPSFDKKTLRSYLQHPDVADDPRLARLVNTILRYREQHTLLTYFIGPYLELNVNGVLHPEYKQSVRTGRMACKSPNMQQVSKAAKQFVVPQEGFSFLSNDYSQIEFRMMMHYGRDPEPILAYQRNPDTDFHDWVKDMCQIPRAPAKNVNFCIGFGGSKRRVLKMLASDMTLMGALGLRIDAMIEAGEIPREARRDMFEKLCRERAEEVYENYHATLPGIRRMTNVCATRAERRGYIKNIAGRHRHMPKKACWRAFNAVVQGSAADIMKRQFVALSPRYNSWTRGLGVRLAASVHDESLSAIPIEFAGVETASAMVACLEEVDFQLRVPMRASAGFSAVSWAEAGSKACAYDGQEGRPGLDRSLPAVAEALQAAKEALVAAGVVLGGVPQALEPQDVTGAQE